AFGPEDDKEAPSVSKTFDGKERPVHWRVSPATAAYGWLDLGALMRPEENACGYAVTFVKDAKLTGAASRPISVWAGSAGAMRVFWNGKEILKDDKYRALESDRFAASVTLRAGYNRLLVKACGDDDAPMVSVRLAGADGSPDEAIKTDADPAHAEEAMKQKETTTPSRVEGPLQAFERMVKSNDPATLEGFARYLVITASDDPSDHRARELARKAAELKPTIPRLLLAGELAENRNQRAIWIEKAEALVKAGGASVSSEERMHVLLARAQHARSGSNWRDAAPYYEKALALDPDDVTAVLARFELYTEANLKETALAFLKRALDRRPKSVALVRAMTSALRQQDRTTEAGELEERYAQLRFDDAAFARGHVDLAIAQRDTETANRWIERLIATNPDNAAVLATAAKAHLLLGDRAAAVATYKKSLDLAPEDTAAMRSLADAYGLQGQKDEQLKLLRQILTLKPQAKEVREYVANMEPARPRADEVYARPSTEFLAKRNAPAMGFNQRTLVNLTVTTVFPNGLASRFHQIVFQPITDSAAAAAREYAFGFEADTEAVQLRGARVYHPNGQVEEAIESGEGPANNEAQATYTSARAFYVHFPRLSPGDVVELQYRVEDVASRNAFADYFGEVSYLQSGEPIGRAEYVLITPKSRTFYFNKPLIPGLKATTEETKDTKVYKFVALDVPPLLPEQMQPAYGELLGHVHVSTYKDWDAMGRWYWGLVKDQFIADEEVRRRVADVTKGLKTDKEKVRAVYDYVVQKTRYVALEFGIHGFKPYRCAQIFARGFGDCKDKATLIVTMLKEAGIPATIVIVRTGTKGDFETDVASLAPFDHAIAYVPSLDLYLDGTAEYTGSMELPAMDRGSLAIQINEGKPKLVHLPDPPASESVMARKVEATILPDGSAQIDWRAEVSGVSASSWRQRYHAEASRKPRVQEDLASEFAGLDLQSLEAGNFEDIESKVTLHVKGKAPQLARREGDRISVPTGPSDHMVRDYAALSRRLLDIRLRANTTTESDWTIHLPPGSRVLTAPVKGEGKSPFGTYRVDVETEPTKARVKTQVTMTKTRITAAEYPAFRAWCEEVDRALGQRLVLSAASK
ncbi:MAG: Cell division protein FtsK, partial [Myxococcaceae bacterium]|nr:Cell division protein FtsK [Myxococcaceae bacterium]